MAWEIWKGANTTAPNATSEEQDDSRGDTGNFDAWDLKHNQRFQPAMVMSEQSPNSHLHKLPNHNVLARNSPSIQTSTAKTPPFLVAHLCSLPRSAPIEWHSLGLARLPKYPTSAPRLTVSTRTTNSLSISTCLIEPVCPSPTPDSDEDSVTTSEHQEQRSQCRAIEFFSIQIFDIAESTSCNRYLSLQDQLHLALTGLEEQHDALLMERTNWTFGDLTIHICSEAGYNAITTSDLAKIGMLIPCRSLWGEEGRRVEIAVVGRREGAGSDESK